MSDDTQVTDNCVVTAQWEENVDEEIFSFRCPEPDGYIGNYSHQYFTCKTTKDNVKVRVTGKGGCLSGYCKACCRISVDGEEITTLSGYSESSHTYENLQSFGPYDFTVASKDSTISLDVWGGDDTQAACLATFIQLAK